MWFLLGLFQQWEPLRVLGRLQLVRCIPWLNSNWWTVTNPTMDAVVDGRTLRMTVTSLVQDIAQSPPTRTLQVEDLAVPLHVM